MKDSEYILGLNLDSVSLESVKNGLITRGWCIVQKHLNFNVEVEIYESTKDYKEGELFTDSTAYSFDDAFRNCLKKMKSYYERINGI